MKTHQFGRFSSTQLSLVAAGMIFIVLITLLINTNYIKNIELIFIIFLFSILLLVNYSHILILYPLAAFFIATTVPGLGFSLEKSLATIFVFVWVAQNIVRNRQLQPQKTPQELFPTKIRVVFFLFLLESLLSLIRTPSVFHGLLAYQALVARGILVYLVYQVIRTEQQFRFTLYSLSILAAFSGLASIYIVVIAQDIDAVRDVYFRQSLQDPLASILVKFTVLRNPNILADYALLLGPPVFSLVLHDKGRKRYFALAAFLLIETALLLSQTRSAYVAAVIQYLLMFIIWRRRALGWVPLILSGILLFNVSFLAQQGGRFQFLSGTPSSFSDSEAVKGRLEFYQIGEQVLKKYPLFGGGLGSFETSSRQYGSASWSQGAAAHSSFLEVATETGYVGLFIFLSLLALLGGALINRSKSVPLTFSKRITSSFIFSLVGLSISSLAHLSFSMSIVWYIAGLALASTKNLLDTTANHNNKL